MAGPGDAGRVRRVSDTATRLEDRQRGGGCDGGTWGREGGCISANGRVTMCSLHGRPRQEKALPCVATDRVTFVYELTDVGETGLVQCVGDGVK